MADIHDRRVEIDENWSRISDHEVELELSCCSSTFEDDDDDYLDNNYKGDVAPYQFEPYESDEFSSTELQSEEEYAVFDDDEYRLSGTDWCQCGHCCVANTVNECVCCQEITRVKDFMGEVDDGDISCVTQHPGFAPVCLNTYVLQTAYYQYRQQYGIQIEESNEKYRYTAYRQFVRLVWGYLRKKVRVTIPSCAVRHIRQTFPSLDGNYTGFNPPN